MGFIREVGEEREELGKGMRTILCFYHFLNKEVAKEGFGVAKENCRFIYIE